jgi:hypothetical protein
MWQDLIVRKSKNQARRAERDFDQAAFTPFRKETGIKQSKTRRSAQRHSAQVADDKAF